MSTFIDVRQSPNTLFEIYFPTKATNASNGITNQPNKPNQPNEKVIIKPARTD